MTKQMSALKLAHNLASSSIRLRMAAGRFHRRFRTTQGRTLEVLSSGNKPSQDHGRCATWEMFFDQNERYTDRFLGLEKDAAKSHYAVGAVSASLDELRRKTDKGLERLGDEVKRLGEEMSAQFADLHGAQKKHEGILVVVHSADHSRGIPGYDLYRQSRKINN